VFAQYLAKTSFGVQSKELTYSPAQIDGYQRQFTLGSTEPDSQSKTTEAAEPVKQKPEKDSDLLTCEQE